MQKVGHGILVALVLSSTPYVARADEDCSSDDWPMFGRDQQHSFSVNRSPINSGNVSQMVTAWDFPTGDAVSASPTVVDGVVYVGSWDGFFYALNAKTGALKWKFQVDCDEQVIPIPAHCPGNHDPASRLGSDGGLITGSALVKDGVVYFPGGKTMYALRARDGRLMWKRVLCGNPDNAGCENDPNDPTRIFSSPVMSDGKLIVGTTSDGTFGYRGRIVALNAGNGREAWAFEVDPILDSQGHIKLDSRGNVVGGYNRGCGSVWASGAVDDGAGLVIFGTGDCDFGAPPPYHEAVVALSTRTGKVQWTYRPREIDICDYDFGATANIIKQDGETFVGVGGKDGYYYLLKTRTHNPGGDLRWKTNVVFGGTNGGFIGSTAYDGQQIFGGTAYGDGFLSFEPSLLCTYPNLDPRDTFLQDPSFHSFDARTGAVGWQQTFSYTAGASSVAGDVVFNGFIGLGGQPPSSLRAYNKVTGQILLDVPQPGQLNSGVTIVGSQIFFGTGDSYQPVGDGIHSLKLP